MSITYAKGSKPQDLEAACGGPTLERVRGFLKDEDCGMLGPPNEQNYAKGSGASTQANRTGDKSLPAIKPRK